MYHHTQAFSKLMNRKVFYTIKINFITAREEKSSPCLPNLFLRKKVVPLFEQRLQSLLSTMPSIEKVSPFGDLTNFTVKTIIHPQSPFCQHNLCLEFTSHKQGIL